MIDQAELRIAPINRRPAFVERLAGAQPGSYAIYSDLLSRIGVSDNRLFKTNAFEVEVREQFDQMRTDPDLRKLHSFSSNWFGVPTRATRSLLWTWGHVERPLRIVEGEELDIERCSQLLYVQEIELPADVSLFETGGLQWTSQRSLKIGEATGISRTTNHH